MGRPRRGGAFPSVAGVRVGYVVRRLASPNALHDVFGVFDAVRRLFPESGLVSFYGLLVLLRYLPSSVCACTRRWGLVGGSAVHVSMRPYSSPLKSLAVLFELVQQRYERRKRLSLDRAPSSLSSTSLNTEARLLAFARLYARVSTFVAASWTALLVWLVIAVSPFG